MPAPHFLPPPISTPLSGLTFKEISTPSVPSLGKLKVYAKDDGSGESSLYFLDDAGIETKIGGGGGGGSTTLASLTDASISSPANRDVLQYVTSTSKWTNGQAAWLATEGGTGQTTVAVGDFLYGTASSTWSKLSIGSNGLFLQSNGSIPAWVGAVDLTTDQSIAGTKTFTGAYPVGPGSTPTIGSQLIDKTYADALRAGLLYKTAVNVATTANITLSGEQTIDGYATSASRILVKNQSTGSQNGVYTTGAGAWTRTTDYDETSEVVQGTTFLVINGTTLASTQWALQTSGSVTVGTTSLSFIQISAAPAYTASLGVQKVGNDFRANYVSNDGLTLSGNSLTIGYDNTSIGIVSNLLAVKALGITNAMLAGSIASSKLLTVAVAQGGTGLTTIASGAIPYGSSSGVYSGLAATTNGYVLTLVAGAPAWQPAVSGSATTGANSITYVKTLDSSVTAVTVSNTTTSTSIYSYTVPANTLSTNKELRVRLTGLFKNNTGANRTIQFSMSYGGVTISSSNSAALATSASNGKWVVEAVLTAANSTSLQNGSFYSMMKTGTGVELTPFSDIGVGAGADSTANQTLSINVVLSIASANMTLTKQSANTVLVNATDSIGAPVDQKFILASTDSTGTLTNYRVSAVGAGITQTDAGTNGGNFTYGIDTAVVWTNTNTISGTNKTLTTPVLTGLPTGTGVASAATASTLASRDANANTTVNNLLEGYTTTATAAGTTTLTVGSTYLQFFTGSTTQIVTLPVTSTLVLGQQFLIVNNSSGAVTVNSSGSNAVVILAGSTSALITCILTSGTTAASWSTAYQGSIVTSGKSLSASNTLTLAGTDSTTMTFPSSSDTVAGLAATQTFTNKRNTPRINTVSSSGTPSINTDTTDMFTITALAAAITSMTTNLTGTPNNGDKLIIRILDNGTARAITWGTSFASRGATLPTTTVVNKYLYVGLIYNTAPSKWDCVAVATEA